MITVLLASIRDYLKDSLETINDLLEAINEELGG